MALQTPQAADMTWKSAGSSPAGLHITKTSSRQAWKAKPTAGLRLERVLVTRVGPLPICPPVNEIEGGINAGSLFTRMSLY
jgi:hypothetical protein